MSEREEHEDEKEDEMTRKEKKFKVLQTLNTMVAACKPIPVSEFNISLYEKKDGLLLELEKELPEMIITNYEDEDCWKVTMLGILSSITEIFGKDSLVIITDKSKTVCGFQWKSEM
jgi:predicted transcriptional regulator